MYIVPGPANPGLAATIASRLDAEVAETESRSFPDGERYVRIHTPLEGQDVVVVQSTRTNDDLITLLLLLDACRAQKATSVTAVVPYFGYARQDQRFQSGEALSAAVVARAIGLDAQALVTIDPHKPSILEHFKGTSIVETAVPELAAHLKELGVDLVLAPDAGARDRAEQAAGLMGVETDHLEKKRIDAHTVQVAPKNIDAEGRIVAIVDDLISTGGTMARATSTLLAQGAKEVHCAATHGLFVNNAAKTLFDAGVKSIAVVDTIPGKHASVSASPAVVRGIEQALNKQGKAVAR
jgi:ribose-phosphate pyrophosphokinase